MVSASKRNRIAITSIALCLFLTHYLTLKHAEKSYHPQLQKSILQEDGKCECAGTQETNSMKLCEQGPEKGSTLYFQKGEPIWKDMNLTELYYNYQPLAKKGNVNGMRYPHQFALYTVIHVLKPTVIIESGIFNGYTTGFMRKINPDALIISMDPRCPKVKVTKQELYCGKSFKDFTDLGNRWMDIPDKEKALVIIDDHQDMTQRTKDAKRFGFKHVLMEDNYNRLQGDALSLKQIFGEKPEGETILLGGNKNKYLTSDMFYRKRGEMFEMIEIYAEFPPLNRCKTIERKVAITSPKHLDWIPSHNDTLIRREIEKGIGAGLGLPVPNEVDYTTYNWFLYVKLY